MNSVEICLASDNHDLLLDNVIKVYQSGAERIELCSAMAEQGLTPSVEEITIARQGFAERAGLMVMIRPRAGDFCYNRQEVNLMIAQIEQAAQAGADGVVFGALLKETQALNLVSLKALVSVARDAELEVGIHRAFDAVSDKQVALTQLIELGVDRVLTSGCTWGESSSALNGIDNLRTLLESVNRQVEIVIAGGVAPDNVSEIIRGLNCSEARVSFHAYSSVLEVDIICPTKLRALVDAIAI